jgi:NADH:ubiquinone oxidoreductase subunit
MVRLKEIQAFHADKCIMDKTYHHMGRDKFQNIYYLQGKKKVTKR